MRKMFAWEKLRELRHRERATIPALSLKLGLIHHSTDLCGNSFFKITRARTRSRMANVVCWAIYDELIYFSIGYPAAHVLRASYFGVSLAQLHAHILKTKSE